jgi:hypothetical protein
MKPEIKAVIAAVLASVSIASDAANWQKAITESADPYAQWELDHDSIKLVDAGKAVAAGTVRDARVPHESFRLIVACHRGSFYNERKWESLPDGSMLQALGVEVCLRAGVRPINSVKANANSVI